MKITAGQLAEALRGALAVAARINPQMALADAGVEILTGLYNEVTNVKVLVNQVMAETQATAPEVAQAVSDFYTERSAALEAEFAAHPGS